MARILLIDDDQALVFFFEELMQEASHQVVAVSNRGALEAALRPAPDLVLLDLNLPGFTARDAVEVLVEAGVDRARLVVHSSLPQDRLAEEAAALGLARWTEKGSDPDAILETVAALLG